MTSLRPYLLMVVFSLACLTGIGLLFWYQDMQYARPTPRPSLLVQQPVGARLLLGAKGAAPGGKPLLLHFFNPSCPCSRFNRRHLRDLYNQYGQAVDMVVVLQAKDTLEAIRKYRDWELPMDYVTDPSGNWPRSAACTPPRRPCSCRRTPGSTTGATTTRAGTA